jgi:hypothetical protein
VIFIGIAAVSGGAYDQCGVFEPPLNFEIKAGTMVDLLNLAMLICATVGSMAFGILAAYGILRAGFGLMRPQSQRAVAKVTPQVARVL